MTFSATDAAFEGFRLVRRHPLSILFWALLYILAFGLFFVVFGASIATLMAMSSGMQGSDPDMAELETLGQTYMGIAALAAPISLIAGAVLNAAVARAVLQPKEKAFGYLRLGMDELRVIAVSIILGIVLLAASIVSFGLVGALAGFTQASGQNMLWLLVVLLGLAAFAFLIWLSLRLSLAVPITLVEKRIAPFASFAMTKGRSMALLGMAIIAFIMSMLVSLLAYIVALPITLATGGGLESLAALDGQSTPEILRVAGPAIAAWVIVNAVSSALQLAVLYAPFAAAYRDLKGLAVEE